MAETAKSVVLILSALFPIVNPLGGSPIFLALTREYSAPARRALSRQIAINCFFLVVISTAWAMLKRPGDDQRNEVRSVGPGSSSVAITLGANAAQPGFHLSTLLAALTQGFAAMNVILRLSSFLLVCFGVQIFWNGASALLLSVR